MACLGRGLASPCPLLVPCHGGVFQPLRRLCSWVALAPSSACRALWLLLVRGQVVLCGFCLAEGRSCSVASAWPRSLRRSPASCGSCTVSSRCRCPTGSRPAVSTCSEVVCFCSSARCSLGLCRGHSARSRSLLLVCDRSGLCHTLCVWILSRILHALFTRGELVAVVPVVHFLAAVVRCPRCLVFRSWFRLCFGWFPSRFCLVQRAIRSCVSPWWLWTIHVQAYVECWEIGVSPRWPAYVGCRAFWFGLIVSS